MTDMTDMALPLPFVGREPQLRALVSAVDAADRGDGAVAFVGGEAGIGKTRLVTEVAARVAPAFLWSRCWEGNGAPAFWPWQQLLRAVLDRGGADNLGTSRPDGDDALRRLLGQEETIDTTDGARFRLFDAVADVFARAAEHRSLVLVLDDLHWADEPSIRLLEFIGRDPRARRLAIIGTYRDSDLDDDHALGRCFAELAHRGSHVSLGGLGKRDVAVLAGALSGLQAVSPSTVSLLHRRTGGNPLFLRELARLLDVESTRDTLWERAGTVVPTSVRAVVGQRRALLSSATQEILAVASVAGADFDVVTVASVNQCSVVNVLAALDEATSAGLVDRNSEATGFGFVHAVVREVIYEGLTPAVRAALHGRVANVLEARGSQDQLSELAHHLLQAAALSGDDRERAVTHAVRAGTHNMGQLAYEDATAWFGRALAVLRSERPDDPRIGELLLRVGHAALAAGDLPRARDAFEQAATLAHRARDPDHLAEAALGLGAGFGGFEVQLLDPVQVQLLEQALEALGPEPAVLRAWVLARLSVALSFMGSDTRRVRLSEEAVAMARHVGDPRAIGYALAGHCDVIAGPDRCETRRSEAEEIIRLGARTGDAGLELLGRRLRLMALLELGEVSEADAEIERFALLADRLRQPLYRWYVPLWKGMRALMRGELEVAARWRAEAQDIGAHAHSGNATVLTFTQWWVQQRYERHFREAGEAMTDLLGHDASGAPPVTTAPRAIAAAQIGDHAKARTLLHQWRASGGDERLRDAEWLPESAQLAEASVLLGARDEAEILYGQLRPYADRFCVEGIGAAVTGSVAWYLALLARFLGHEADAEGFERAARAAHGRIGLVGDPPPLAAPAPGNREEVVRAPSEPASLSREGATWAVSYAGRTVRLRDSKGLRDIAVLLARPGEEVHCLELIGGGNVGAEPGPTIDQAARRAYEHRIRELQEDVEDARAANDPVVPNGQRSSSTLLSSSSPRPSASRAGHGRRDRQRTEPALLWDGASGPRFETPPRCTQNSAVTCRTRSGPVRGARTGPRQRCPGWSTRGRCCGRRA